MSRFVLALALVVVSSCAIQPPFQSSGDLSSPVVQASWEAVTPPVPADAADALDEALSACTGPLQFGLAQGDPVSLAQWCDCYRERAETDRHAYRRVCTPAPPPRPALSGLPSAEPRASPVAECTAPEWPDLRGDLDDALGALRQARGDLATERAATDALRVRAEALRKVGAGCRRVVGKDSYHQLHTTTWACDAEAEAALEVAVSP